MAWSPAPQVAPAQQRDIVVIGASAGGVEALRDLVRRLPSDFPAAVFVVLHLAPTSPSVLPAILQRVGRLPAAHPDSGERILPGRIYVAPPDRHMVLRGRRIDLSLGPRENRSRPAIDPLFRSAAAEFGPRVVGIVLSGSLDDGSAGLRAVAAAGGLTIVQDPDEAVHPEMPKSAMEAGAVDHCLKVEEIATLLVAVASAPPSEGARLSLAPSPELPSFEALVPTPVGIFVCPECHGPLQEVEREGLQQFQCRVGHLFSPESLEAEKEADIERTLFTALQSMEDGATLARRLAERAAARGLAATERRYSEQAVAREEAAASLRRLLATRGPNPPVSR